jgi:Uma2 family endonuclease
MSVTSSRKGHDHWHQIPATWATYRRLLRDRGERNRPKYIFLNRRLTIVSPGAPHEQLKTRMGGLIEDICVGLRIPFLAFGETTYLKSESPRSGSEPDESYYLTHIEQLRHKKKILMGEDPAPDLVVEVVFSHPARDALEVYRRFGVREVWVCKHSEVVILALGPDSRYTRSATSVCLPALRAEDLTHWAYRGDFPSESELRFEFRAWVTKTFAPMPPAGTD